MPPPPLPAALPRRAGAVDIGYSVGQQFDAFPSHDATLREERAVA